jgi:hypothetical protein
MIACCLSTAVLVSSTAGAQPGCADRAGCTNPSCAEKGRCVCGQEQPCFPPTKQQPEAGAFVAPAQPGVVQGASNGMGVRGLEIEFPAFRLALPTIRFPSMFRTRANARMLLERGEAAFVGAGQFGVGQAAVGQGYGLAAVAPSAAALSAEQIEALRAEEAAALRARMQELDAARAEAADAKTQAAEEKLRELEEAERRLNEKIRRLQECLDALLSAQHSGPPVPPPNSMGMRTGPPETARLSAYMQSAEAFSFNHPPALLDQRRATALFPLPPVPHRLPEGEGEQFTEQAVRPAAYLAQPSVAMQESGLLPRRLPPAH